MERTSQHDELSVFLGKWTARGTSFGGTDQSGADPKTDGQQWLSTHEAYWHTGKFFLLQDERADISGSRFDTLFVIGVTEQGEFVARIFENHGFYREYAVEHQGDVWTFSGVGERATYKFDADNRRQNVVWEWKRGGVWLPLCDRVAVKVD
ncbi:hypothetical protein [Mesorhizobium sp. 10J20-29]